MKANELMQGDLVLYEYNGEKIHARVVEIYRTSALVESVSKEYEPIEIAEDKLFPVAISPEILEKNGAKHSVYEHPYFDYEPTEEELNNALQYYPFHGYELGTNIQIAFYPKEIRVEVFGQDFVDMFKIRGRNGNVYVHELQHALRLCGIEKEIEL